MYTYCERLVEYMIEYLANRVFELFSIKITEELYAVSLFELGLSAEQVLYFLFDLSRKNEISLSKYYNVIKDCSLIEIRDNLQV